MAPALPPAPWAPATPAVRPLTGAMLLFRGLPAWPSRRPPRSGARRPGRLRPWEGVIRDDGDRIRNFADAGPRAAGRPAERDRHARARERRELGRQLGSPRRLGTPQARLRD